MSYIQSTFIYVSCMVNNNKSYFSTEPPNSLSHI